MYLNWEIYREPLKQGDQAAYIDDRLKREEMVNELKCVKIKCGDAPPIASMKILNYTQVCVVFCR